MKITRGKAITECKRLWLEIEKSGLSKKDFLGSTVGQEWSGKYLDDCPLCHYVVQLDPQGGCFHCPLWTSFGKVCWQCGYDPYKKPTLKWLEAIRNLKEGKEEGERW